MRLRSGVAGTLVLLLSAFALSACIVTADQSIEGNPKDPRAQDIADKMRSIDLLPRQTAEIGSSGLKQQTASRPAIYLSDGSTPAGSALIERESGNGSGYDLNFEVVELTTLSALGTYFLTGTIRRRPLKATAFLPFALFQAPAIWLGWLAEALAHRHSYF